MQIEKETLEKLYIGENKTQKEVAEILETQTTNINYYLRKFKIYKKDNKENIGNKNHRKTWTKEQEEYLIDNWGKCSLETLSKSKKIQRSPLGVRKKARQLKLGDLRMSDEYITKYYLTSRLKIDHRTFDKWCNNYGLKAIKKSITKNQTVTQLKLSDFWNWAENHKELIKWNRFEIDILGVEPQWTTKTRADYRKNNPIKLGESWSNEEDRMLESSYKAGIPIEKIAKNLGRSRNSTDQRLCTIMVQRKEINIWDEESQEELKKLVKQGLTTKQIAVKMDKPFTCVRGARERYISKPKKQMQA